MHACRRLMHVAACLALASKLCRTRPCAQEMQQCLCACHLVNWRGLQVEGELPRPWRAAAKRPPAGSRLAIDEDPSGHYLAIKVAPSGVSGGTAFTGAFALIWNGFVATWTVGALAGGGVLFALFSLPFWWAGIDLTRRSVLGFLLRESLDVDAQGWALEQELARLGKGGVARFAGGKLESRSGETSDLLGAKVRPFCDLVWLCACSDVTGAERVLSVRYSPRAVDCMSQ